MEIIPFVSFFTGVISILSPCILPILPIFAAFSMNSSSKHELLSFIFGLMSIFLAVIFFTGFFTSLVYGYIFYIRIVTAVILFAIGCLMLFDYTFTFKSLFPKNNGGIWGSFVFGLLTSLSWAPCYGAYLISLIALLVSSNDAVYAIFNIGLYCLGFALTLLILSIILSKINLDRIISKTNYIPKIFAILIIVGAIYLFYDSFKILI